MKYITTKTIKLSICSCGESVLNDSIELGTEYTIYPESIKHGFKYHCGRCNITQNNISVILANSVLNSTDAPRYLPIELFEL